MRKYACAHTLAKQKIRKSHEGKSLDRDITEATSEIVFESGAQWAPSLSS